MLVLARQKNESIIIEIGNDGPLIEALQAIAAMPEFGEPREKCVNYRKARELAMDALTAYQPRIVTVAVSDIRGPKVRIGVEAPRDIAVNREEVYEAIKRNGRDKK